MPSTNKRINLTVPPETYERIKKYMVENGELSDAGACLHMIVKQLNAYDFEKKLKQVYSQFTPDQLKAISMEGTEILKAEIDKNNNK